GGASGSSPEGTIWRRDLDQRVRGVIEGAPMTERDALLAAIRENPEDAPRLVFADWLEEHEGVGRSEQAKAALQWADVIRRQIAAERCPRTDPRFPESRDALWRDAKAPAALALVPASCKKHARFHRGFPDRLDCSLRKFLSIAGDLPGCRAPLSQL